MNEVQNEKQLIPIKKIITYTVVIGVILIGIAYLAGVFTIGVDGGTRFGAQEQTEVPE